MSWRILVTGVLVLGSLSAVEADEAVSQADGCTVDKEGGSCVFDCYDLTAFQLGVEGPDGQLVEGSARCGESTTRCASVNHCSGLGLSFTSFQGECRLFAGGAASCASAELD